MSELSPDLYCHPTEGYPITLTPGADATAKPEGSQSTAARRWRVLHDVFQPRAEARGVPFEYVIEVTSRCNLSCPMCPRRISPSVGNEDMSMDTFHRVLEGIRDVASFIWFAGLGEPFMNRHFMQMITECHNAGIATGASTNGTFLTDRCQQRLLDSRLDVLLVSFDGADKETYESVRIGANFDKVYENVRQFAARKARQRARTPWLILQMIELSRTKGQVRDFRRMWNIPGVDAVRIKKDELQFDESLTFEGQGKRKSNRPCPFLWRGTLYIQCDGATSPCCYGAADKSFGNITGATVEELWNSPRVREVRRAHLAGRGLKEPFCKNCNALQPGRLPMAASVLLPSLMQKKHAGVVETINRAVRFLE